MKNYNKQTEFSIIQRSAIFLRFVKGNIKLLSLSHLRCCMACLSHGMSAIGCGLFQFNRLTCLLVALQRLYPVNCSFNSLRLILRNSYKHSRKENHWWTFLLNISLVFLYSETTFRENMSVLRMWICFRFRSKSFTWWSWIFTDLLCCLWDLVDANESAQNEMHVEVFQYLVEFRPRIQ